MGSGRAGLAGGVAAMVLATSGVVVGCGPNPSRCDGRVPTIVGTAGNDTLAGTEGDDVIVGLGGRDVIDGFGGNDVICTGAGLDDLIRAGAGDDLLDGSPSDHATLNGGDGVDTVSYQSATSSVEVDLADHRGGMRSDARADTIALVEDVIGSRYADSLAGDTGRNRIVGLDGPDRLSGSWGDDQLADTGPAGQENVFDGGPGNDVLYGGPGRDRVVFGADVPSVRVNLGSGWASGEGDDLLSAIDDVWGTVGNDMVYGDAHANALWGEGGDDTIQGFGGDDFLLGGPGGDTASWTDASGPVRIDLAAHQATGDGTDRVEQFENIRGGNGDDTLLGDTGPNVIDGWNGVDGCTGGGGQDVFFRCP